MYLSSNTLTFTGKQNCFYHLCLCHDLTIRIAVNEKQKLVFSFIAYMVCFDNDSRKCLQPFLPLMLKAAVTNPACFSTLKPKLKKDCQPLLYVPVTNYVLTPPPYFF